MSRKPTEVIAVGDNGFRYVGDGMSLAQQCLCALVALEGVWGGELTACRSVQRVLLSASLPDGRDRFIGSLCDHSNPSRGKSKVLQTTFADHHTIPVQKESKKGQIPVSYQ